MSSEQPHPAAVGGEDSNAAGGGQPGEQSVEDIRKQVETEQALSDAQRKVKDLEAEVERIKNEVRRLEEERSGSGLLIPSRIRGNLNAYGRFNCQPTASSTLHSAVPVSQGDIRAFCVSDQRSGELSILHMISALMIVY